MLPDSSSALSLISIIAVLQNFLPAEWRDFVQNGFEALWNRFFRRLNPYTSVEVHEELADGFQANTFYHEVEIYLSSLETWIIETDNVKVCRSAEATDFSFSLPPDETVEDTFKGAQMLWTHHMVQKAGAQPQGWWDHRGPGKSNTEDRSFSLKLLKTDRARLLREYFDYISKFSKEQMRRSSQRKIYTNDECFWEEVDFKHPSTFDTIALMPEVKESIMSDLKTFSESEDYYHKVGRAWKRGYLLYGPPGTGKSSMIAAMSNLLNYDIYDLELTRVTDNSCLKSLLIRTTRKSIIVLEDIDCSLDLSDRAEKRSVPEENNAMSMEMGGPPAPSSKVTLSGILNFTDGLWSCCGEERIFVMTTNHKERLDAALLRSGRMDFHILLSYCTFSAFKQLAQNYLGLNEHELFKELEEEMRNNSRMTPADVVDLLIRNKEKPELALHKLLSALREPPSDLSSESSSTLDKAPSKNSQEGGSPRRSYPVARLIKRARELKKLLK